MDLSPEAMRAYYQFPNGYSVKPWQDPCECDDCQCDCPRDAYAKGELRKCLMCREGDHEPHPDLWRETLP